MRNPVVFTTFSPADDSRARRKISEIAILHPNQVYIGRHVLAANSPATVVQGQIDRSHITLVLVGRNTLNCPRVVQDLQASLAKTPPNAVIYVMLDEDFALVGGSPVGTELRECGAEGIESDLDGLDECFERARRIVELPVEVPPSKGPSKSGRTC